MKDAALRHLMLLTGRAVATVHAVERARVDEVCTSLHVTAEGRGAYRLEYRLDGASVTHPIAPRRFDFYRRGDVASLNDRRPQDLDLRTTNWHAAMTTWSEILGRDDLTATVTVRAVLPATGPSVDRPRRLREIAGAIGAAGVVGVAARRHGGGLAAGLAATAWAAASDDGRTRRVSGGAGGATALLTAGRRADRAGVVGAMALSVFAADVPRLPAGAALPIRLAAAGLAGAASPGSAAAVVVAASADVVGGAVGRDRRSVATGSAAVGVALAASVGRAMAFRAPVLGTAVNPMLSSSVAIGLIVENVARSLEGTRSRLAPLVVPAAIAGGIVPRRSRSRSVSLGAGLVAASVMSRVAAAAAPTSGSVPVATVAVEPVDVPTPVVVRPTRAATAALSPMVVGGVDTDGTEVASSS